MSEAAVAADELEQPPADRLVAELAGALVDASVELVDIERTKTADAGTYTYRYVDLAAVLTVVRPVLHSHGLAVLQLVETDQSGNALGVNVRTLIVHRSGATLTSPPLRLTVPSTDPQRVGSAITYGRRYSLMATLNLAGDDDDDGAAAGHPPCQQQQRPAAKQAAKQAATGRSPQEAQARELLNAATPEVRSGIQRAFREHFGVSLSNLARDRHAEALSFVTEQLTVPEPEAGP